MRHYHSAKKGIFFFAILFPIIYMSVITQAQAAETCQSLAAERSYTGVVGVNLYIDLTAGDKLRFTTSSGGNTVVIYHGVDNPISPVPTLFTSANADRDRTETISVSGRYRFVITANAPANATVQCISAGSLTNISGSVARIGQQQVSSMMSSRIRQLQQRSGRGSDNNKPVTSSGLSLISQQNGKNAGGANLTSGVWGNMAVTHFADTHRPTDLTGLQGAAILGLDTELWSQLFVGGAINLEKSYIEMGSSQGEVSGTAMGISPYISWQIDEIFSLSALSNISFVHSRIVQGGTTEINMNGLRWQTSVTADAFQTWGNWALLSGLSFNFGQMKQFGTKDSNGNNVSGSLSNSGNMSLLLQPSYYWQYDDDLALEPYFLAEYQYDFTMQKVSTAANEPTHPNDHDQFRLGLGMNIFGGRFYSGSIEASTVLGRQKYDEATISSSLRINF